MVLHIFRSNNLIECERLSQKQKHTNTSSITKLSSCQFFLQMCQQGKHEYIYAHKQPRYKITLNLIVPVHQNTRNKTKDAVAFVRHQTSSSLVEGAFFSSPTSPTAYQFSRFCQLLLKTSKLKLLKLCVLQ